MAQHVTQYLHTRTGMFMTEAEIIRHLPHVCFGPAGTNQHYHFAPYGFEPVILPADTPDTTYAAGLYVQDVGTYSYRVVATPVPVVIPEQVTRLGAMVALDAFQLLDAVEQYMAAEDTPRSVKLAWQHALHFERRSGVLLLAAQAFGLTDEQLDALFLYAANVKL